ncbi:hypothetical protein ABZ614_23960 [Streptomyces sp. NPDC013178]|uniref:hypothetical protein n=1 Tax=unclassified Streptomyces TaxID=2593676 RepID=UPI0033C6267E
MRAESSPGARTGEFVAVALALSRIPLDFPGLKPAVPVLADEFGVTPARAPKAACGVTLRRGGAVMLAASLVVMAVRRRLVALGRVPSLGSRVTPGGDPP